jgi:hypothetical protein
MTFKSVFGVALLASVCSAAAWGSCPDLTGVYEASYILLGQQYHVVSSVTQQGCETMIAQNQITGPHGVQNYAKQWSADGIFRRKDTLTVESAVFTSKGLLTTEVQSPQAGAPAGPQRNFFSRTDLVSLDADKNMVNTEVRYDEQGNQVGTDQFVYKRRAGR